MWSIREAFGIALIDDAKLERHAEFLLKGLLATSVVGAAMAGYFAWNTDGLIRKAAAHVSGLESFMSRSEQFMDWFDTTEDLHSVSMTAGDESSFNKFLEALGAADVEFTKLSANFSTSYPAYRGEIESIGLIVKQELESMKSLQQIRRDKGLVEVIKSMKIDETSGRAHKMRSILTKMRHAQLIDFENCREELQNVSTQMAVVATIQSLLLITSIILGLSLLAYSRHTRKNADAAHRLATLVKSSHDAIFSTGIDQRIDSWNPASELLFSLPAAEALGAKIDILVGNEKQIELRRAFDELGQKRNVEPYNTVWYGKGGRAMNLSVSASPLLNGDDVIGAMFVARDISALISLQEQKRDFIAALTHDLKNPLVGNSAVLNLLIDDSISLGSPESKEILEKVVASNIQMLSMIGDFLDIYKLEAASSLPNVRKVDLRDDLELAISKMQPLSKKKNLEFLLDLNCNLEVETDKVLISRIIINLLDNAIKYSPSNSTITLKAESVKDRLKLSVIDCGPGISDLQRARLFEELCSSESADHLGHGVGLYLSQKIARSLHCDLFFSTSAEGCEFVLSLPRDFSLTS